MTALKTSLYQHKKRDNMLPRHSQTLSRNCNYWLPMCCTPKNNRTYFVQKMLFATKSTKPVALRPLKSIQCICHNVSDIIIYTYTRNNMQYTKQRRKTKKVTFYMLAFFLFAELERIFRIRLSCSDELLVFSRHL